MGDTNDDRIAALGFARRELVHPDTLRPVTRYVMTVGAQAPALVRACPACGGNPNEAPR